MATTPIDIAQLEADFQSGRNPLAYVPLCQALRKSKRYVQALDVCMQGLARDRDSVAGRTLYCRILADLGRYEDAVREIEKTLENAPESMGLLVEKARCLIRMHRYDEAETVLNALSRRNPLEPAVQYFSGILRELKRKKEANSPPPAQRTPGAAYLSTREIGERLMAAIAPIAPVHAAAVIPLDAGEPSVVGAVENAEASLVFCQEVGMACIELDMGKLSTGVLESERRILFIAQRNRLVVCLAVDQGNQLGKVQHRFQLFLKQIFREDGTQFSNASLERVAKI